jgi:aryl-alcohol dehydrogenase-like predicted oxidoreductase
MQIELTPGYRISRLIKGGWHLAGGHGPIDRQQAITDMAQFVQAGFTTFDCADIYTGVEELIGDFRQSYPELAPRVQVHTKLVPDYDRLASLKSSEVESIVHRSRQRLRQDTLDLVQFHWWDTAIAGYLEVAQTLRHLQAQGYIRHIGLTNFNTAYSRQLVESGLPVVSTQVQYSVLDRRPEAQLLPYTRQQGIGLLVYGSLAGGFISPQWLNQPEPSGPFDNRSLTKYKLIIDDTGGWELFQALLHTLHRIGQAHGASLSQVAVAWVLHQPGVTAAIIGATSSRHLQQNLAIPQLRLSPDELQAIERIRQQGQALSGDVFDLERDKQGRHGRIMKYNLNRQ